MYLTNIDLCLILSLSGETAKVKSEKIEVVAPQGSYQQKMAIGSKTPKTLISFIPNL